jgi:hypothetical protein
MDPTGAKFGQRVRVMIQVGSSAIQPKETRVEEPTIPFSALLDQLAQMGFDNKGLNIKLLVEHKCDLDKVVMDLLKRQKERREREETKKET